MANGNRASEAEFKLNTEGFDEAARICKEAANRMTDLKNSIDHKKAELMFSWAGEGRDTFEKKYHILSQQFGDLGDSLRDIAESIYEMEQTYIQEDVNLAKTMVGENTRF